MNLFINDLAIGENDLTGIVKYADDTTLLVKVRKNGIDLSQEVVNQFFSRNIIVRLRERLGFGVIDTGTNKIVVIVII